VKPNLICLSNQTCPIILLITLVCSCIFGSAVIVRVCDAGKTVRVQRFSCICLLRMCRKNKAKIVTKLTAKSPWFIQEVPSCFVEVLKYFTWFCHLLAWITWNRKLGFTISLFLSLIKKMLKIMLTGMTADMCPTVKTIYIVWKHTAWELHLKKFAFWIYLGYVNGSSNHGKVSCQWIAHLSSLVAGANVQEIRCYSAVPILPLPSQCAIKFYFEPVQSSSQHIHLGITLPSDVALLVSVLVCSASRSQSHTKQNTAVKWWAVFLVFEGSLVQITVWRPAILAGFHHSLRENVAAVP
jgi:hypothetical protein